MTISDFISLERHNTEQKLIFDDISRNDIHAASFFKGLSDEVFNLESCPLPLKNRLQTLLLTLGEFKGINLRSINSEWLSELVIVARTEGIF